MTVFGKLADQEGGGLGPKEPSCLGLDARFLFFLSFFFLIEQRVGGEEQGEKGNVIEYFLVPARLQRGCINFFFLEAIHRWAWSGCFL